ncbi:uncharacterized protein LOC128988745 isoform X1 [Macrosteles quadrilineatus]|uniref:uncharacterized protein LOC128988745 isoform X1 n=1 Tax=Macrosteles quadrilineatus TaxID=74068 RepID=UPI0023E29B4E|nr:uncharacterized protein LOC128988745 isoform X1 [Macrosteles quadrilineatus]
MVQVGLLLVMVVSVVAYREIEFKNCKTATGTGSLTCKVKNVKINGCMEPSTWVDKDGFVIEYVSGNVKNPCGIDTTSTLNFSITFEPGYNIDTVRSQFTVPDMQDCWRIQDDAKCPVDIGPESGCSHTKCPLQSGRQQRYETSL